METTKFHLSYNVSDIDKTVTFYEKLFGTQPVKTKTDYAKFELDNPGLVISFLASKKDVHPGFGHLGFRVNSSKELMDKKRAIESQIEIALEEENTACCYARQDKFWVNDPDGYRWEVYHFVEDVEKTEEKQTLSPCC